MSDKEYGPEWQAEMMKHSKVELVDKLREAWQCKKEILKPIKHILKIHRHYPVQGRDMLVDAINETIGANTHREGQQVKVSGVLGMTEINGNTYQVKASTAEIADKAGGK